MKSVDDMDIDDIATDLLDIMWVSIDSSYKSKYRRNIWDQFENNIRSAAYTRSLRVFFEKICKKMSIIIKEKSIVHLKNILSCGKDDQILKMIRDQTVYFIVLVRARNEERKERYKDKIEIEDNLWNEGYYKEGEDNDY